MHSNSLDNEKQQTSNEERILLVEYKIVDGGSIVDFRNKIKNLATDLIFSNVTATRLATVVSEICHNLLSKSNRASSTVYFSLREGRWELEIAFQCPACRLNPMNFDFIFDHFQIDVDAQNNHVIIACKTISNPQFEIKTESNRQRQKLNQMTQEELMRELHISLEKAQEADAAKSDFLANMSHEIRTPMNAIIGLSELTLNTSLTSKQQSYITKINSAGKALLGIINDILDFSKIEAGKMDMETIPFQLDKVLDNLSTIITLKAQEKGLEVIFSVDSDVPNTLTGDPLRLGQILTNLCNNAVKFTETGEIIVRISVLEQHEQHEQQIALRFEVEDSGIGLKPEQIKTLFSSFSQADTSTTRKYGGTGLGLSICKNLVHMMNGEIWVASLHGEGSRFIFTAQFDIAEEIHNSHKIANVREKMQGMKVLIVDDNETARSITEELLRYYSVQVSTAKNGLEAIEMVNQTSNTSSQFDLILMDWQMPEMNGITASEIIKTSNLPATPKVILMTAYGREEIILKAEQAKIDGFLVKPVNTSAMLSTILETMGKGDIQVDLAPEGHNLSDNFKQIHGAKVLLVEDNEVNQIIAMELLENMGLNVNLAHNGQEGVTKALASEYACILMDLQMPVMDGLAASRRLRQSPDHQDIPIIAMTANAMKRDQEQCRAAGMSDHIAKPIDTKELYRKLLQWIDPRFKDASFQITNRSESPHPEPETSAGSQLSMASSVINSEEALQRLDGDSRLFKVLLNSFYKNNQDTVSKLQAAVDDNDHATGERLAHTLRGSAASLGANRLAQIAGNLESKFEQGQCDVVDDQLRELSSALADMFAAIIQIAPQSDAVKTESASLDIKKAQSVGKELQSLLELGEFAEDQIEDFIAALRGHAHDEDLEGLKDAVEIFDDDDALEYLNKILSSIK